MDLVDGNGEASTRFQTAPLARNWAHRAPPIAIVSPLTKVRFLCIQPKARSVILAGVDIEQTIAEIERLERIFAVPDPRPLSASDISAANRNHDQKLANSPWFRLWQHYGICCRPQAPTFGLGEIDS
jgi:hypothetical protein